MDHPSNRAGIRVMVVVKEPVTLGPNSVVGGEAPAPPLMLVEAF